MKVYVFVPPVIAECDGRVRDELFFVHKWPKRVWRAVRQNAWPGIIKLPANTVSDGWWFGTADAAREYAVNFTKDLIEQIDNQKATRCSADDRALLSTRAQLDDTLQRYKRDGVMVHWLDDSAS